MTMDAKEVEFQTTLHCLECRGGFVVGAELGTRCDHPKMRKLVDAERERIQAVVTSRLRERTEALHKAKFWVDHGSSGSDFEVLKDCLRHASSDFAGAVQDVRSLLSAIDDQDQQKWRNQ